MMEQIKAVKSHYLYNMLQDFRHVLVFDLRDEHKFDQKHIRDSYCMENVPSRQKVEEVVSKAEKKAEQKEEKYKQLKRIRRYFFVDELGTDINAMAPAQKQKVQIALSVIPKDKDNKFYLLSGGFEQYFNLYPYTCLVQAVFDKLKAQNADQKELEKALLYPYCRFPTEIIPGKLYLGNIFSSNSQKQLQDVKIKCLVDFIEYEPVTEQNNRNPVPAFKRDQSKYDYFELPLNKEISVNINFDIINEEIDRRVKKGPTLLYCQDGETVSAAFAIAYLMWKTKLDINMATLKVCQAISRTDITKWLYTQLLVYKPQPHVAN